MWRGTVGRILGPTDCVPRSPTRLRFGTDGFGRSHPIVTASQCGQISAFIALQASPCALREQRPRGTVEHVTCTTADYDRNPTSGRGAGPLSFRRCAARSLTKRQYWASAVRVNTMTFEAPPTRFSPTRVDRAACLVGLRSSGEDRNLLSTLSWPLDKRGSRS